MDNELYEALATIGFGLTAALKEAARAQELAALASVYNGARTPNYPGFKPSEYAVKHFAKLVGINLPE